MPIRGNNRAHESCISGRLRSAHNSSGNVLLFLRDRGTRGVISMSSRRRPLPRGGGKMKTCTRRSSHSRYPPTAAQRRDRFSALHRANPNPTTRRTPAFARSPFVSSLLPLEIRIRGGRERHTQHTPACPLSIPLPGSATAFRFASSRALAQRKTRILPPRGHCMATSLNSRDSTYAHLHDGRRETLERKRGRERASAYERGGRFTRADGRSKVAEPPCGAVHISLNRRRSSRGNYLRKALGTRGRGAWKWRDQVTWNSDRLRGHVRDPEAGFARGRK